MDTPDSAESAFDEALREHEKGNAEEEARLYRRALQINPNYEPAWVNLHALAHNSLWRGINALINGDRASAIKECRDGYSLLADITEAAINRPPGDGPAPFHSEAVLHDRDGTEYHFDFAHHRAEAIKPTYDKDFLRVWGKDPAFLRSERFIRARQRSNAAEPLDWRVHICCWAAEQGLRLAGDFVECGVYRGEISSAVCHYIDLNATGRAFYLFDTYIGIPVEQLNDTERPGVEQRMRHYLAFDSTLDGVRQRFREFPRAIPVPGKIPDTLTDVDIDRVCYLHIDMNVAYAEVAALEFFWHKLSPGAFVVLDDYGWTNHAEQRKAMDRFAQAHGVSIATLPTGQGLFVRP